MANQTSSDDQIEAGQRPFVDMAVAMRTLGITREAVRLRIRRGTLVGRKVGANWRVQLPESAPEPAESPLIEALRDEVAMLRGQVEAQNSQLEAQTKAQEELRILLLRQSEQLSRLLPAPRPSAQPTGFTESAPSERPAETTSSEPRRKSGLASWWEKVTKA